MVIKQLKAEKVGGEEELHNKQKTFHGQTTKAISIQ